MIRGRKNYEKKIKELEQQIKDRDLLLKHISHKCEQSCKVNWLGNPSIGFRQIKELAKTFN